MASEVRDVLICEPRFVVSRYPDGSVRITAGSGMYDGGSVHLSPEQLERVVEALRG